MIAYVAIAPDGPLPSSHAQSPYASAGTNLIALAKREGMNESRLGINRSLRHRRNQSGEDQRGCGQRPSAFTFSTELAGMRCPRFALTPASVVEFRNRLLTEGRSPAMSKKVVICLGAILSNAIALGKLARNILLEQSRQHGRRQRRLEKRHQKKLEIGVDIPTSRTKTKSASCWLPPKAGAAQLS